MDDKELENLAQALNVWNSLSKTYILNPEKVAMLTETQQRLQELLDEEGYHASVDIRPCPLGFGDAVVSFEVDELTVRNIDKFLLAMIHLQNFEIHPVGDEKISFAAIVPGVARVLSCGEENG